ncbi:MAG: PAS domain S-box protein, partial [Anaerolineae bacterium]|nr:PAS domain S-box protein [Anaerolineae bacterium]
LEIASVNPAATAVFGYSGDHLVGQRITRLILPWSQMQQQEQLPNFADLLKSMVASNEYQEMVGQREDGTTIQMEVLVTESIGVSGSFYIGFFRDITERKRAELSLQRSEVYFRSLIERSSDLTTILDERGFIAYISPVVQNLLGYKPEYLLGRSVLDLVHPEDQQHVRYQLRGLVEETRDDSILEARIQHRDGHWLIFQAVASNLLAEDAIAGIVLNARDMTERRDIEQRLLHQAQYLATLHEISLSLLERLDPDTLLQTILYRAGHLLDTVHGYVFLVEPEEDVMRLAAGTGLFGNLENITVKRGEGLSGRVWESGQPLIIDNYSAWEGQISQAPQEGQIALAVPLKYGDDVIGCIGLTYTDSDREFDELGVETLTMFAELATVALDNARLYSAAQLELEERIRAQDALSANRANLRALIENTNDYIWSIDPFYRIIIFNTPFQVGFENMFGVEIHEDIHLLDLLPLGIRESWKSRFDAALAGQEVVFEEPFTVEGITSELEFSFHPIRSNDDQITGVSCVARDITERKQTERQLKTAKEAAESANIAKSAFLANMSH